MTEEDLREVKGDGSGEIGTVGVDEDYWVSPGRTVIRCGRVVLVDPPPCLLSGWGLRH